MAKYGCLSLSNTIWYNRIAPGFSEIEAIKMYWGDPQYGKQNPSLVRLVVVGSCGRLLGNE